MTNRTYTPDEIKAIVTPIAQRYGVARVFLFGSYARGDAAVGSDIDLRIDEGAIHGLFQLCGFHVDLETALNAKVDVLTTDGLTDKFKYRIAKEEMLIYG